MMAETWSGAATLVKPVAAFSMHVPVERAASSQRRLKAPQPGWARHSSQHTAGERAPVKEHRPPAAPELGQVVRLAPRKLMPLWGAPQKGGRPAGVSLTYMPSQAAPGIASQLAAGGK